MDGRSLLSWSQKDSALVEIGGCAVSSGRMYKRLSIVVVEKDRDRAITIVDSLREAGDHEILVIGEEIGLARRIAERDPDLVLIDAGNPSRDALEELTLATGPLLRPVAMFVDESDGGMTQSAIEAGVSAYVVAGLSAHRIRPVLDAAIARFHMMQKMRVELAATRRALEERKVIDRAKGIVMRAKGIGEDEAYALMRKTAMDQGRKVAEVAQALVTAAELLK
jgi:two-component system, response regulator / RNA-binding antiterminator